MKTIFFNKKNITNYFIVLLLVLFSGLGNSIFRDIRYSIIPISIAFLVFYNRRKKITKNDMRIFVMFFLFILGYFIKYRGEFDPAFTFRVFSYISLAYFTLKILGVNFFRTYEDIIYYLAFLSLPLFLVQAINYNFLYGILRNIQAFLGIPLYEMNYANIFIFTLNKRQIRNCGFAWEPGGFSEFLILALIVYLARNKFNIKRSRFWVLIIALLTTFSTTGYLALAAILIWYIYNIGATKRMILIPIILIGFVYASTLPFMIEKITQLSEGPQEMFEYRLSRAYITGNPYSLGRFAGFVMNIKDFLNHPIIGYGGHGELSLRGRLGVSIFSINGIGDWLARYGSIGFIILVYLYMKSFNLMSSIYNFKKPIILLGVIFVLGFGFGLLETSLFFTFMLSGFVLYPVVNRNFNNE